METLMRFAILCFVLLSTQLVVANTGAAETTAQFAAPGVRAPDDPKVNGFRFSFLYGKNQRVGGLDVGLLSISETSELSGVGLVFGIGMVTGGMDGGAAFSLVNVHTGSDTGLNAAFINKVNNAENAVDFGFVNIADGTTLVDIGGLNIANSSTAQIGFINITKKITGFQFGFINVAENGFLPVFPIFNFPKTSIED